MYTSNNKEKKNVSVIIAICEIAILVLAIIFGVKAAMQYCYDYALNDLASEVEEMGFYEIDDNVYAYQLNDGRYLVTDIEEVVDDAFGR